MIRTPALVHELIESVKSGDEKAMELLCSCFRPELIREAKGIDIGNFKVIEQELCELLILEIKKSSKGESNSSVKALL